VTRAPDARTGQRRVSVVDAVAPPERLAMLRILVGAFAVGYLVIRLPVYLQLGDRRSGFDGVGLAALVDRPVPSSVVDAVVAATMLTGVGFVLGWRFRVNGPLFAVGMLALGSYRGSWGQLLHFENLMVIYLLILAVSPASDAWSIAARHRARHDDHHRDDALRESVAYGFPIALAALALVITYVIAGVAKLRYGGLGWVFGDTLRNHVAYAAARLDLLGGSPSPFAGWIVRLDGIWPLLAAGTIVIELAAPVALLGGRIRTAWVIAAWLLHAGVLVFMLIGFPFPLFLVAFAPLYRVERLWTDRPTWLARSRYQRVPRTASATR
jgi:hypothetical protein